MTSYASRLPYLLLLTSLVSTGAWGAPVVTSIEGPAASGELVVRGSGLRRSTDARAETVGHDCQPAGLQECSKRRQRPVGPEAIPGQDEHDQPTGGCRFQ